MTLTNIRQELKKLADTEQAVQLQRFFKTGPGQYGEGDIFLGLKVPVTRAVSLKFKELDYSDLHAMLKSRIHEERLCALFILVNRFRKSSDIEKEKIYNFYLENRKGINNWDLVDLSADKIVGGYLFNKDLSILYNFAKSDNLWERRISILSTFYFIKKNVFLPSLQISEILLTDKHDLIHKAVGWMLREIGKRDIELLEGFLQIHYKNMPRTMLRYAIEKFPENRRQEYLKGRV